MNWGELLIEVCVWIFMVITLVVIASYFYSVTPSLEKAILILTLIIVIIILIKLQMLENKMNYVNKDLTRTFKRSN